MLARKFRWLYFIIALEKKGRAAAKLFLYSFSLLKSSEKTVVVLITYSSFFPPLASSWSQQVVAVHFSLAVDNNSLPTSSPKGAGQTRSYCLFL